MPYEKVETGGISDDFLAFCQVVPQSPCRKMGDALVDEKQILSVESCQSTSSLKAI